MFLWLFFFPRLGWYPLILIWLFPVSPVSCQVHISGSNLSRIVSKLAFLQVHPQTFSFKIIRDAVSAPVSPPPLLTFLFTVQPLLAAGASPAPVPGFAVFVPCLKNGWGHMIYSSIQGWGYRRFSIFLLLAALPLCLLLLPQRRSPLLSVLFSAWVFLPPSQFILWAAFFCPGGSPCCSWPFWKTDCLSVSLDASNFCPFFAGLWIFQQSFSE